MRSDQAAGLLRAGADAEVLSSALSASERTAGDLVVSLMRRSYPEQAAVYLQQDRARPRGRL